MLLLFLGEADGLDKRIIIRIQCKIFVRIGCFHTNRPVEHISEDRQEASSSGLKEGTPVLITS